MCHWRQFSFFARKLRLKKQSGLFFIVGTVSEHMQTCPKKLDLILKPNTTQSSSAGFEAW